MEQSISSTPSQIGITRSEQEIDPAVEAYLNGGYDKHVKRARRTLFMLAGIQLLGGVFMGMQVNAALRTAVWIEVLIVSGIIFALAFWSKKKPYAALQTAVIFYLSYQGLSMLLNPVSIFQGIILKVIIVVYLFLGLSNAKSNA